MARIKCMGVDISVALKTAASLYSSRKMIVSFLSKSIYWAINSRIVVTGAAGVGKSYLFESIVQELYNKNMKRPTISVKEEVKILYLGNGLIPKKVSIIPGQKMSSSLFSIKKNIESNEKLKGVIHLIDWGYTHPRDGISENILKSKGINTIEKLREYNLSEELSYLEYIVDEIINSNQRIKWFALLLNKTDLYDASKAMSYYSRNERFMKIIEKLRSIVPDERMCLFLPVCADIRTFSYGDLHTIPPSFVSNNEEKVRLLRQMMVRLEMIDEA